MTLQAAARAADPPPGSAARVPIPQALADPRLISLGADRDATASPLPLESAR